MSKEQDKEKKSGPVEEQAPQAQEPPREQPEKQKEEDQTTRLLKSQEEKIAELETELSSLKDQYLRKQADFENFRKRIFREKEDAVKYANGNLLIDLVTIIDDFERAIKSSEDSKDFDSFHSGIALIEKQFIGLPERNWGLKRFESAGQEFDPEKHEALMAVESAEHDAQTVLEDFQKGYMLHDRVIRHAKVKVAIPSGDGKNSSEATPAGDPEKNVNEEEIQ